MKLYERATKQIIRMIESGGLAEGEMLPSESELAERLNVSKITIRRALAELRNMGYIATIHGKGSFVNHSAMWYPNSMISFTEDMQKKGKTPSSIILDKKIIEGTEIPGSKFEPGTTLFYLKRIRQIDGEPVGVQEHYIRYDLVPGIEKIDFEGRSLYKTMEESYGVVLHQSKQEVTIKKVAKEEAQYLDLNPRDSVFSIKAWIMDEKNFLIGYAQSLFRSDRYKITLLLKRN